jgi:hypothetical protein
MQDPRFVQLYKYISSIIWPTERTNPNVTGGPGFQKTSKVAGKRKRGLQ